MWLLQITSQFSKVIIGSKKHRWFQKLKNSLKKYPAAHIICGETTGQEQCAITLQKRLLWTPAPTACAAPLPYMVLPAPATLTVVPAAYENQILMLLPPTPISTINFDSPSPFI